MVISDPKIMDFYAPFDAGPGSEITEDQWRTMQRGMIRSGIRYAYKNSLAVSAIGGGVTFKVDTGGAFLLGHYGEISTAASVTLADYGGTPRFDLIVVHADFTANTIDIRPLTGAGGISVPALTRNATTWEIPLALIAVTGAALSDANITRIWNSAAGPGGLIVVSTNAALPDETDTWYPVPEDGRLAFEKDKGRLRFWHALQNNWRWCGGQPVGFEAKRSAHTSNLVSGTWTAVTLDVDTWDPDTIHGNAASFTLPETGMWQFGARVLWQSAASGSRGLGIHIDDHQFTTADNGGEPNRVLQMVSIPSTVTNSPVIPVQSIPLGANNGDIVTVCGFQSSGSGIQIFEIEFWARLVGYIDA